MALTPFGGAAADLLLWADGEYTKRPNTAKRLHTIFVSLLRFFRNAPVSSILCGHVNDYKAWQRKDHAVRERGIEVPSDKDAVRIHVLTAGEEMLYFQNAKRFPALHDLGRKSAISIWNGLGWASVKVNLRPRGGNSG